MPIHLLLWVSPNGLAASFQRDHIAPAAREWPIIHPSKLGSGADNTESEIFMQR
ncbi:hypothetical protein LY10_03405 [Planktotalea frisia]|uniref:Uncharacterized protein n=1 Tax=Planktotalea frisia TaxID=696762 RepID=A0A1L9NRP3_9RHOB|nr:hypothetical protein PFRI_38010 [Planktotalea frisia]PZX22187.1 hypothetical protein LY10_03405 [Planktotalea frisia]